MASTDAVTAAPDITPARRSAWYGVLVVVVGTMMLFGALMAFGGFRDFLAGSEDAQTSSAVLRAGRVEVLAEHRGQVFAGFALVALGQLLLGVGMAVLVAGIGRVASGWRAVVSRLSAWSCLGGGVLSVGVQLWPPTWRGSDTTVAELGLSTPSTILIPLAWGLFAAGFFGAAVVLVSDPRWPSWPGVVLIVFGLAPFLTKLPLFFQVGAVIAGVGVAAAAGGRRR